MAEQYLCKIASLEEMNTKWDYEIAHKDKGRENWVIWKKEQLEHFRHGWVLPYYGILDGQIICEATANIRPEAVQNSEGLVDEKTVYLSAFRTIPAFQGQGYFSRLFRFMLADLRARGFTRATLGVEPEERTNKAIYFHYGFRSFIKAEREYYPDGTAVDVEYYGKDLD